MVHSKRGGGICTSSLASGARFRKRDRSEIRPFIGLHRRVRRGFHIGAVAQVEILRAARPFERTAVGEEVLEPRDLFGRGGAAGVVEPNVDETNAVVANADAPAAPANS